MISETTIANGAQYVLEADGLQALIVELQKQGYCVIAPTIKEQTIALDEIESLSDLPKGYSDEQSPGKYRIASRGDSACFAYANGAISCKRFLFPPRATLFTANKTDSGFEIQPIPDKTPKYAFLGIHPCDMAAVMVQDKVFMSGDKKDDIYAERRKSALFIVANCGYPSGACFCASMNTGPKATKGFDLALTEVIDSRKHYFVIESGSEKGTALAKALKWKVADAKEIDAASKVTAKASKQMGRKLDTKDIRNLLYRNFEHPRWEEVAERCMNCANCTMSCPTCFCHSLEDYTDVPGLNAERRRKWDSCFTLDFSYIHGGYVRSSVASRYRQWMTHKLASWHDQFGMSGCVGCGRCITWCPVGIDITEEAAVIRQTEPKRKSAASSAKGDE